ncbi:MAG TPA: branched-chain amino acid ABC transporter permease, partial [Acidimicrobiales bacterium]
MSAFWYYAFTLVFFLFDYFILAMGLNIQYGETGILNFAYIGFVAIGAYVTGAVSLPNSAGTGQHYILGWGLPFPINLLIGGLTASAFAVIVALITLRRLRTDYLAMVLISLSLVLYDVCINYVPLFNGADGLYNIPEPLAGVFKLTTNSFIPVFAVVTGVISMIM